MVEVGGCWISIRCQLAFLWAYMGFLYAMRARMIVSSSVELVSSVEVSIPEGQNNFSNSGFRVRVCCA